MGRLDVHGAHPVAPLILSHLGGHLLLAPIGGGVVDERKHGLVLFAAQALVPLRELFVLLHHEVVRQLLEDERPAQERRGENGIDGRVEGIVALPHDDELSIALHGEALRRGERADAVAEAIHGVDHEETSRITRECLLEAIRVHDVSLRLGLVPGEGGCSAVDVRHHRDRGVDGIVQPGGVLLLLVKVGIPLDVLIPLLEHLARLAFPRLTRQSDVIRRVGVVARPGAHELGPLIRAEARGGGRNILGGPGQRVGDAGGGRRGAERGKARGYGRGGGDPDHRERSDRGGQAGDPPRARARTTSCAGQTRIVRHLNDVSGNPARLPEERKSLALGETRHLARVASNWSRRLLRDLVTDTRVDATRPVVPCSISKIRVLGWRSTPRRTKYFTRLLTA